MTSLNVTLYNLDDVTTYTINEYTLFYAKDTFRSTMKNEVSIVSPSKFS